MSSNSLRACGSGVAATALIAGAATFCANVLVIASHGMSLPRTVGAAVGLIVVTVLLRTVTPRRLLGGCAFLTFALLFLPILVVLVYAFNGGNIITQWAGFSTRWFSQAFSDPQILTAIGESLKIALGSSLISVVLACAAALVINRTRLSLRLPYEGLLFLTLVVPELVLAIGLLLFFMRFGVPFGLQTVMVAHAVFGTSVALLIIRARYTGTGLDLERASADLGAGPWATLRQVTIPRLSPAIIAAFLLTFVLSFDDVVISQFTAGGTPTWPLYLLSALRFGISPEVNAASALLLAVILIVAAVTALIMRRLTRVSAPHLSTPTNN